MAEELKTAKLAIDDLEGEFSVTINGKSYKKISSLIFQMKGDSISIEVIHDDQLFSEGIENKKEIFDIPFNPVKINLNIEQLALTEEEKQAIDELINKAQKGDLDSIKAIKAILKNGTPRKGD